jgi:Ig-like domain from next to BRCA1 gene
MSLPLPHPDRLRLGLVSLGLGALLAACNYPGLRVQPHETPTSPPIASLPAPEASDCIERMTVLAESGYLDATPAEPGQVVERVWHVRNSGTCTWTPDYELVPVEGLSFGLGPIALNGTIAPGEETDLRLQALAPETAGFYSGGWALRSPRGALLGAGSRPLRLRVNVSAPVPIPTRVVYDFFGHVCEARWVAASPTRAGRLLPCPGYDLDPGGFLLRVEIPRFANGYTEDEPGLILHPPNEDGGLISGTFPAYTPEPDDQFRVLLGCSAGSSGCQARCQLNYRDGDALSPIAEWIIGEGDGMRNLGVDLSFLLGRSVEFVLAVDADGPGAADAVIWMPAIMR